MNADAIKPASTESLEAHVRALCLHWGPGYTAVPGRFPDSFNIRTPEQGVIGVRLRGQELELRAEGWPQVNEGGFRRSFAQELSARVSAARPAESAAQDLQRRLLAPYAAALAAARGKAADYRRLIADVGATLDRAGLTHSDRHVLGHSLQAHKPHGALDDNGQRLPTASVTTITAREEGAVGNVEVRSLSLPEVEALHVFIQDLIARRRPVLRLSA